MLFKSRIINTFFSVAFLVIFTCACTIASEVTLESPEDGETLLNGDSVAFDWSDHSSAETYTVVYTPDGGTAVTISGLTSSEYTETNLADGTYSWYVEAYDSSSTLLETTDSQSFNIGVQPGELWAWGRNSDGQLGDGTTALKSTPVRITLYSETYQYSASGATVVAGYDHSLCLDENNYLWTWGSNDYGQLGDGTTTERTTPVLVAWLYSIDGQTVGIDKVYAGKQFTVLITDEFTNSESVTVRWVIAWGRNTYGQLGTGDTTSRTSAVHVATIPTSDLNFFDAALGGDHFVLAGRYSTSGWLYATGRNNYGQLCNTTTTTQNTLQLSDSGLFYNVTAGTYFTSACKYLSGYYRHVSMGNNSYGQFGNNDSGVSTNTSWQMTMVATDPVQEYGWQSYADVNSAGYNHRFIRLVNTSGTEGVCPLGRNNEGQLGKGDTTDREIVTTGINLVNDVRKVDCGEGFSLLMREVDSSNKVYVSGDGGWGQHGDGTTTSYVTSFQAVPDIVNAVDIAAGRDHCLAVIGSATTSSSITTTSTPNNSKRNLNMQPITILTKGKMLTGK